MLVAITLHIGSDEGVWECVSYQSCGIVQPPYIVLFVVYVVHSFWALIDGLSYTWKFETLTWFIIASFWWWHWLIHSLVIHASLLSLNHIFRARAETDVFGYRWSFENTILDVKESNFWGFNIENEKCDSHDEISFHWLVGAALTVIVNLDLVKTHPLASGPWKLLLIRLLLLIYRTCKIKKKRMVMKWPLKKICGKFLRRDHPPMYSLDIDPNETKSP